MGPRYQIMLNSLGERNEARQYLTVSGDDCSQLTYSAALA